MRRLIHPLDRYVFGEFLRVFFITALGFPLLVEIIDLVESLPTYLDRNLPRGDIALSYFYWLPDAMFLVLPAAVLFATVFTIGSLTRHSELTAAKASGISFHRVLAPILLGAVLATAAGLGLGEIAPRWNRTRMELLRETVNSRTFVDRAAFSFLSEEGRVYNIGYMRVQDSTLNNVQILRHGTGPEFPTYMIVAGGGRKSGDGSWHLTQGSLHITPDSATTQTFAFDSLTDNRMREGVIDFTEQARTPEDMNYAELGNYVRVMERAGVDVNKVRVERMLKLAVPATCLIIVLFGAPLATSTQRGGAAYGVGISLATTVLFLVMIQLTKAFGGKGVISPELAAWIPSIAFGILGAFLLVKVRT